MKLSVIIPTYNRASILEICLNKITRQQGVDFEVIVVDDDSKDRTAKVVKSFKDVIYIKQKKSQQGTARNKGIKKATGDIILFIGDDIFAGPGFLMQHMNIHVENPDENVVVLGYTTWDPFLEITTYMKFLESSGWQFAYYLLNPGFVNHPEPYKFFYTSNISLKKSILGKEKFNTKFREYGWEDVELGYRLWKEHEMRLYYEPDAIAYHHHMMHDTSLEARMQTVGRSAVQLEKIQPDIQIIPRGLKAAVLKVATWPFCIAIAGFFSRNLFYKLKSWQHFIIGTRQASPKK